MPHKASNSEPDSEDLEDLPFDVDDIENTDPYEVLGLNRSADQKQIKKAYYGAAQRNHPDKVKDNDKDDATKRFQKIQFAYTILSDEDKKARYDRTGSTKDAAGVDDGFSWKEFFDNLKKVSTDDVEVFKSQYQGSEEEKDDVLAAYTEHKGKMDEIYEHVMCSNVLEDDDRFRAIIDQAIEDEEVVTFKAYTRESQSARKNRTKKARAEAKEAEKYAKELNLPANFFGGKDNRARNKKGEVKLSGDDALKMLIQQRQDHRQQRFFESIEAKYLKPKAERNHANKRKVEEPPEEMFEKNRKKGKTSS